MSYNHFKFKSIIFKSDHNIFPYKYIYIQTKIITGEGMPMHQFASSKGDLIIHYIVDIPKKFTDADKKLIKSILSSK